MPRLSVLWAVGGLAVLAVAALGGLGGPAAIVGGSDRVLHDTYIVVARFHHVLTVAVVFGFFAAWYALFPRITGYAYSRRLGDIHFWLTFIGTGAALVPYDLVAAAVEGHAAEPIRLWSLVAWVGSFLAAAGFVVFLANMAFALLRRRPAG